MLKSTKNNKYLAVIPARGGSKRLPGKNLKPLAGVPLLNWTIDAARNSSCIDKVIVSSDDDCILALVQRKGVVGLRRPAALSADTSSTVDALRHAVTEEGEGFDHVVLLQPTSPLRNEIHIDAAIDYYELKNCSSVVSVCEVDHSPQWANTLPDNNSLKGFIKSDVVGKRSQDLEIYYRLNGAIYIISIELLMAENRLIFDDSFAFIMDKKNSVDIDTIYDFIYAEAVLKYDANK